MMMARTMITMRAMIILSYSGRSGGGRNGCNPQKFSLF